jgi:hypothetical protein
VVICSPVAFLSLMCVLPASRALRPAAFTPTPTGGGTKRSNVAAGPQAQRSVVGPQAQRSVCRHNCRVSTSAEGGQRPCDGTRRARPHPQGDVNNATSPGPQARPLSAALCLPG